MKIRKISIAILMIALYSCSEDAAKKEDVANTGNGVGTDRIGKLAVFSGCRGSKILCSHKAHGEPQRSRYQKLGKPFVKTPVQELVDPALREGAEGRHRHAELVHVEADALSVEIAAA